jgi:hypothetical protein
MEYANEGVLSKLTKKVKPYPAEMGNSILFQISVKFKY